MTQTNEYTTKDIHELLGLKVPYTEEETSSEPLEEETEELLEPETVLPTEGTESKKGKGFAKNPWLKLVLISFITGAGAVFVGTVLLKGSTLNLGPKAKVAGQETSSNTKQQEAYPEDTLTERNAKLTGEVAVGEQRAQIKAIKDKLDRESKLPQNQTKLSQVTKEEIPTPIVIANSSIPAQASRASPSRISKPVVYTGSRPAPLPTSYSVSTPQTTDPRTRVPTMRAPSSDQEKELDPMERWQALARLGSYGEGKSSFHGIDEDRGDDLIPLDPSKVTGQKDETEDEDLASDESISEFQPGLSASAKLLTPIVWAQGLKDDVRFVVTLSEPLSDLEENEILPKDTEVVFQVQQIHESGMILAQAVSLIQKGREYAIPKDAIQLRGNGGEPLLAKLQKRNQGQVFRRDVLSFMFGALSEVGAIANRPQSTSSFSGFGGTSSSTTYNEPDYIGAVLDGGFSPMVEQIQKRNQTAISQLQAQPALWWLEGGTELQIQIARSFSLGEDR